jgi:hypothetical protein
MTGILTVELPRSVASEGRRARIIVTLPLGLLINDSPGFDQMITLQPADIVGKRTL